jgi:hypothetical protein
MSLIQPQYMQCDRVQVVEFACENYSLILALVNWVGIILAKDMNIISIGNILWRVQHHSDVKIIIKFNMHMIAK